MQKHQYKIFFILQTFIYKRSLLAALYERTNAHFYVTIKLAKRSSSASQSDKTSVSPFRAEEGTQQTSWGGFVMARSRIVETSFLSRSDNIIIISRWQGSLKGALCKLFRVVRALEVGSGWGAQKVQVAELPSSGEETHRETSHGEQLRSGPTQHLPWCFGQTPDFSGFPAIPRGSHQCSREQSSGQMPTRVDH